MGSRTEYKRLARFLKVVLLSSFFFIAAPSAASFIAGSSCEDWASSRHLNVPGLSDVLDERPSVHPVTYLPASFKGLTVTSSLVLLKPGSPRSTLAHELTHVHQMKRSGLPRYAVSYAWQWYMGMWHGCSIADARDAVSFEQEADKVAALSKNETNPAIWAAWDDLLEPVPPVIEAYPTQAPLAQGF